MTSSCVLNHRINGCELFWAFGAMEVLGFLMMMQDDFVLECFLTIKTKWFQAGHISSFSTHFYDFLL
jgi:hypothetical protein